MSYQVLARKWRPRNFHEMVGQEHVLTALVNALDHQRLHHAYLFTGTRGVGKTTIARIFAKCLNCETGISSNPCGTCASCTEIAEGRFVDLIEVDAASRTKVEDTRELLDNVQYAPTRGRFKVYLIDEVHMLSGHSFNALLKTLEEPPPHIKFLLATTDPQKLPVTILSRCLQFHLKNMSQERIVGYLSHVLAQEQFGFQEPALWQLARAADGSMRDALSLTDQAIAFGNGQVNEAEVSAMLGTIDRRFIYTILTALAVLDGPQVLQAVAEMAEHAPDYAGALADIISVLHRVALAQTVPSALDNSLGDQEQVLKLAQSIASEDVQLFYQMALHGRKDISISPDPRAGFEMTLLRMLAFKPQGVADLPTKPMPKPDTAPVAPTQTSPPEPDVSPITPLADKPAAVVGQAADRGATAAADDAEANFSPPVSAAEPAATHKPTAPSSESSSVVASAPAESEALTAVVAPQSMDAPPPIQSEEDYFASSPPELDTPVIAGPETAVVSPVAESSAPATPAHPETVPPSQAVYSESETPVATQRPSDERPLIPLAEFEAQNWLLVYPQLKVTGVLQSTVSNCVYAGREGDELRFDLDQANATLYSDGHQDRMAELLSQYFGQPVTVVIRQCQVDTETPAAQAIRLRAERHAQAVALVQSDPFVQRLVSEFAVELDPEKIEPTCE